MAFVFSTFEVPGQFAGTAASVGGINDFGQIAGTFTDGSGRARIFVRTDGHYDTVLISQANSGLTVTGLNNLDLVVGTTNPAFYDTNVFTQQFDPFTRQFGKAQSYVSPFPNFPESGGVNDAGEVAGYSELAIPSGTIPGTSFIGKDGTFTALQIPPIANAYGIEATAINDLGQITGSYDTVTGVFEPDFGSVGFVDTDGAIKTVVAIPGIPFTEPTAINNLGEVAGNASLGQYGPFFGFVDIGGKITTFEYPGATSTVVTGINDLGQVVGEYYNETETGLTTAAGPFVATPVPAADQ